MSLDLTADWEKTDCPGCQCNRGFVFLNLKPIAEFEQSHSQLIRCPDCQLVFLSPRPNRNIIGQFYSDDYAPHQANKIKHHKKGSKEFSSPPPRIHAKLLDYGCGNGAFTQLIAEQSEPLALVGNDPSEAQHAYARQQPPLKSVDFVNADAMALPFPDDDFDLAVMPLVIFFVPEPAQGVAEMVRVVAPGGTVAAYAWDMEGGGFPYQSVNETLVAVGRDSPMPPSVGSSRLEALRDLWLAHVHKLRRPLEHRARGAKRRSGPGGHERGGGLPIP